MNDEDDCQNLADALRQAGLVPELLGIADQSPPYDGPTMRNPVFMPVHRPTPVEEPRTVMNIDPTGAAYRQARSVNHNLEPNWLQKQVEESKQRLDAAADRSRARAAARQSVPAPTPAEAVDSLLHDLGMEHQSLHSRMRAAAFVDPFKDVDAKQHVSPPTVTPPVTPTPDKPRNAPRGRPCRKC